MKLTERKKLAILESAASEFLNCGFDGANIDHICQLAEVSKRTLYRHFDSKKQLFIAVLSCFHQTQRNAEAPRFSTSQPLHEQLVALLQHEMSSISQIYSLPMLRMILIELLRQPDLARAIFTDIYEKELVFQIWIEAAIEADKLIASDAVMMGRLLQGMFNGLFIWPKLFTTDTCDDSDQLNIGVDEISRVFLSAYQKYY